MVKGETCGSSRVEPFDKTTWETPEMTDCKLNNDENRAVGSKQPIRVSIGIQKQYRCSGKTEM